MRSIPYKTEQEALDVIAIEDAHRGYPRTEQGIRVGGGRHVETITTKTTALPIETDDGRFAVPQEVYTQDDLAKLLVDAVEVTPRKPDPTTVAGGAKPAAVAVVEAVRIR